MRISAGKSQQQSLEDKFKVQKIPSISDMIRIELPKFGLEVTKQTLPQPVQNMMDAHGGKSTPNIQKHRSEQFNRSYLCRSITEYNKLSIKLKCCKTTKELSVKLKRQLFQI